MTSTPKLKVKILPLGDRVVVMPIETQVTTSFDLVIPDTVKGEKPQQGLVIALGDGKILNDEGKELSNPRDFLKVGDKILFGKYAGDEVKVKDENGKDVEVKVLRLDSVLGKIEA